VVVDVASCPIELFECSLFNKMVDIIEAKKHEHGIDYITPTR